MEQVKKTANGYDVWVDESACCSGLSTNEPVCAYSLGVFIGAFEIITGKRLNGREEECKASGQKLCLYRLEVVS